jgi:hypothetical protein
MKRPIITAICIVAALAAWSCDSDKTTPSAPVVPSRNPTQDDVLHNLEAAYIDRNFAEFEKLLDDNFEFYFSRADFNSGAVPFESWGRIDEVNTNQRLLDPDNPDPNRVISIDLDLDYASGDWTPEPPDSVHSDETWYVKNAVYRLVIKTADAWEYRAIDVATQFRIRKDDGGRWRIVEWRDDHDSTTPITGALGPTVQETTWGAIKSLYYRRPKNDG